MDIAEDQAASGRLGLIAFNLDVRSSRSRWSATRSCRTVRASGGRVNT
jgi:hypothetical protein